jgi:hypothetical protein
VSTSTPAGSRSGTKRSSNARLAVILGLIAVAFYVAFIVAGVLTGHAP